MMKLGIDSYCYHRFFGEIYPFQKDPGNRWSFNDFILRAAELQVEGISLETCFLPGSGPAFWKHLADTLDEHRLDRVLAWGHPDGLEGGGNTNALGDLIQSISAAASIGSKVMRIVGSSLRFRDEPHGPQIDRLSKMLRQAVKVAEANGVVLALENHIDFTAHEILQLIDTVNSDHLAVNFDTGNALRLFEDPEQEARLLAPYIRATHIKDLRTRRGGTPRDWNFWESVPAGEGIIDIPAILRVLKGAGYQGLLCVELDCLQAPWQEDEAVEVSLNYLRREIAQTGFIPKPDSAV